MCLKKTYKGKTAMQQSYTDLESTANQLQETFHKILSPERINQLAKLTRLVIRSRCFVPSIFLEAVMTLLINGDKEFSLRSIHERYGDLMDDRDLPAMSWEPFYDFLAKKSFLPFVIQIYDELKAVAHQESFSDSADLVEVLKTKLPNLRDVYLQDGSEVACLCKDFKGKIDNQAKIHRTFSLTHQTEVTSTITSGVASERAEIDLSLLKDILLMADAGYVSNELFKNIADAGGMFLIKLKSNTTLVIDSCIKYNDDGSVKAIPKLNMLAVTILIYYFGNSDQYKELKKNLIECTLKRIEDVPVNRRKISAEFVIFALDMATCPYIYPSIRVKFLQKVGVSRPEGEAIVEYIKHQKFMFTKWTGIDITKELNAKISQEVYS